MSPIAAFIGRLELVRLRIPTAYGQRSWGASQVVGVLKRLERLSPQEPTQHWRVVKATLRRLAGVLS